MLFGLALLTGLVGFAIADPFALQDDGDENGRVSGQNDDAVDGGINTTDDVYDLLGESAEAPEDAPEGAPEKDTTDADKEASDDTVEETDVIDGTDNGDLIYGGDGDYTINGGDGDDQLHGGDGSNTLNGNDGDDQLHAGAGFVDQSINILNGGDGDDVLYGSNEAENTLNGGDGNDQIHIRGHDTATGGAGADSFNYSTEYSDGAPSMITDYNADDDQIIVEHMIDETGIDETPPPEVSITIAGNDAVICLDGDECIVVQGAANSLTVEDILLRATPVI